MLRVIVIFAVVIIVAVAAIGIYVLSSLAGATGNPQDVVIARDYLWLIFGLPVVVVAAVCTALYMLRTN